MLSLTGKRWVLEHNTTEPDIVRFLFQKRRLSDAPCPPPLFRDASRALNRIELAIEHREHIAIFGDYDCDGITATAQLVRFFRRRGVESFVRLPHRENDGYGLQEHIVREFIQERVNLLITVDTGISSAHHIAQLQKQGVDVVIMDHHEISGPIPDACAIIHPMLADVAKPYPSAAGIVYSILPGTDGTDIALACIGTIADVVELKGWNRMLVQKGIQALRNLPEGPLTQLKNHAVTPTCSARDIAFRIAPRINAAGRMDDPMIALKALLEGGEALRVLETLNTERQADTRVFFKDACERTERHLTPFLCIASPLYPPGIVGLLAGKLAERYGRPTLVGSVQGPQCTASLRSPLSFNVLQALHSCSHLLSRFGGHSHAAGCTFPMKNLAVLQATLSQQVSIKIPKTELVPSVTIDLQLRLPEITLRLCEELQKLEPFGEGNPEPRFLLTNVTLQYTRCVGSEQSHLQAKINGQKSIGFGLGKYIHHTKKPVDIVCRIGIDEWKGHRKPQILIEDLRPAAFAYTGANFPSI